MFPFAVAPVQGQNLYVFSVIETTDSRRPDRRLDAHSFHKLTDDIARYGNYTQHRYEFSDSAVFTPQMLRQTLSKFKPQSAENDMVWLHYAGRGYSDGPKAWPTLQLNGGDIPLRELLALLRAKPVRTLLVTVDCGNRPRQKIALLTDSSSANKPAARSTEVGALTAQVTRLAQTDIPDMAIVDAYKRLFKAEKVQQIIVMASAGLNERAYSDPQQGSVWLTAFTNTIAEAVREQATVTTWKQIQDTVVRLTQKRTRNRQTPLFNRQTITCCETEVSY